MSDSSFSLVDLGCLMMENDSGRWIVEHPSNGYFPTHSKMWDVLVEHPESPHSMKVKFLGSFKTKKDAVSFINNQLLSGVSYFNISPTSNKYYNIDYSKK
jgi:hypothetical protein